MPSPGKIAAAAFFVAAVSGIALAIAYDVHKPYSSVQIISLSNGGGMFLRAIHYWSGQLFFVLTLIHTVEHLAKGSEKNIPMPQWFRLVVATAAVLFVMFSGYILKGDKEGILARQIAGTLLSEIPWCGKVLEFALLGPKGDMQILYLHHIASATLLLTLIIAEHTRRVWPLLIPFILTASLSILLSFFFPPLLHDPLNPVVKGPWYFLGMQEALHWTGYPLYAIAVLSAPAIAFCLLPALRQRTSCYIKRVLFTLLVCYGFLTIFAWLLRGANWKLVF